MKSNQPKYYSSFIIDNIHFTVITSTNGIREIILNIENDNSKLLNTIKLKPDDPEINKQIQTANAGRSKKISVERRAQLAEIDQMLDAAEQNIGIVQRSCGVRVESVDEECLRSP